MKYWKSLCSVHITSVLMMWILINSNLVSSHPSSIDDNLVSSAREGRFLRGPLRHFQPNSVIHLQDSDSGLLISKGDSNSGVEQTPWLANLIDQSIFFDGPITFEKYDNNNNDNTIKNNVISAFNKVNKLQNRKKLAITLNKPPPPIISTRKANAAFVMLVRENDLYGAINTVRQIEDRFNRHHLYPFVFLNDKPFSAHFQQVMQTVSKAEMAFGLVPVEHWSYPDWISKEKAKETRERMKNIIYGSSESYRHMCRYQSGFIQWHELMLQYDYYWRIEPDVKYSCDIDFDPFLYMQDNNKKYAFTISLYEYPETIQGLWNTTKGFMEEHPSLLTDNNAMDLISNDGGQTYNNCHFWSNFEIVDTRWMKGDGFQKFFQYLDRSGGFFYERWGDAPVHTIAAALLLPINEIHFFREIGYFHPAVYNCPAEPELQAKCHCDPENNVNRERVSCTAKFLELAGEKRMLYPEEVDD